MNTLTHTYKQCQELTEHLHTMNNEWSVSFQHDSLKTKALYFVLSALELLLLAPRKFYLKTKPELAW